MSQPKEKKKEWEILVNFGKLVVKHWHIVLIFVSIIGIVYKQYSTLNYMEKNFQPLQDSVQNLKTITQQIGQRTKIIEAEQKQIMDTIKVNFIYLNDLYVYKFPYNSWGKGNGQ